MNKKDLEILLKILETGEDWLIDRTLRYAKKNKYVKYTSTLREAWRLSISGLSKIMIEYLNSGLTNIEINPDSDYESDRIAAFGIEEARLHRSRGITLVMFLGLMKYYRQSYLDIIEEYFKRDTHGKIGQEKTRQKKEISYFILRFFDRVEIGFCSEWSGITTDNLVIEMQNKNRFLANEKNKYLTVFESQPDAVVLLKDFVIDNMNLAAARLFSEKVDSGVSYYGDIFKGKRLSILKAELKNFKEGSLDEITLEKNIKISGKMKVFRVKFKKMLDVSEKFNGIVVMLSDVTDLKDIQEKLEFLSMHDQLTGLYNRFYLEDYMKRLSESWSYPVTIISCDIDGLKIINDILGHEAGDSVISTSAKLLSTAIRKSDVLTRMGGDEFAIILPDTSFDTGKERVKRIIEIFDFYNGKSCTVPLNMSLSFATAISSEVSFDDVLRDAD